MRAGPPVVARSAGAGAGGVGLTGAMRAATVLLLGTALLSACSLFGHGRNPVPEGDAWRSEVITAISQTPGVTATDLSVHDVDSGTGHQGPLLQGAFSVEGETASVVDEALRRASDVLGRESAGVRIKLSVRPHGGGAQRLDELGYPGVGNGEALWEATH